MKQNHEDYLRNDENNSSQKLEKEYKELKDNYERLITINKKLNEQSKIKHML